MRFFNVLLFSTAALAAPAATNAKAPEIETRQQTVTGTVLGAVQNVITATDSNLASIRDLLEDVDDNVGVDVEAAIRANLQAIAAALQQATTAITGVTTGAAGGIINAATGLTQQQINQLIQAVNGALEAIGDIQALIEVTATDLTPDLRNLLQTEINNIQQAINPFISPVVAFARAAQAFSARVGVTVTGLAGVVQQLTNTVNNFLRSLGLGILGL